MSDQDDQNNGGMPAHCKMCGTALNSSNRSKNDSGLCKMCAGEQDDPNDYDDFK